MPLLMARYTASLSAKTKMLRPSMRGRHKLCLSDNTGLAVDHPLSCRQVARAMRPELVEGAVGVDDHAR